MSKIDLTPALIGCAQLSSAHIPERTAKALGVGPFDNGNMHAACVDAALWEFLTYEPWGTYGWIIWCSDEQAQVARNYEHLELAALIDSCVDQGVSLLQLDECGYVIYSLPTFEW